MSRVIDKTAPRETISVSDKWGFCYIVTLVYSPHNGFALAYFDDRIIGDVELGRITQPMSDLDHEWEAYEERLCEWMYEIKLNMLPICTEHFNNQH